MTACSKRSFTLLPPLESVALHHTMPATLHPLPGDNSAVAPPDPIPNSEVKRSRADGSVHPHARVGHRQGLYPAKPQPNKLGFCLCGQKSSTADCGARRSREPRAASRNSPAPGAASTPSRCQEERSPAPAAPLRTSWHGVLLWYTRRVQGAALSMPARTRPMSTLVFSPPGTPNGAMPEIPALR